MFVKTETINNPKEDRKPKDNFLQYNLLNIRPIRRLLLWRKFPYVVQFQILIILLGLIILGWGVYSAKGTDAELFAKSNIVCSLIWGVWWPLMIWTVIIFGRVWCMICPLEFISRLSETIGRYLHLKQFTINNSIKGGSLLVALYGLVQLFTAGTNLHQVPHYTVIFLTSLIVFSAFIGLFFKNGAFCKGFCPIAMTLNTYSRRSMLAVRAESVDECSECKDKSCIKQNSNKVFEPGGGGCPACIYPPKLKSNKDCILCARCIKACTTENMKLLIRPPYYNRDLIEKTASGILTAFVMIDSGFVIGELAEELALTDKIFTAVPNIIAGGLNIRVFGDWIEGIWKLLIFPVLLWTAWALVLKAMGKKATIKRLWKNYALKVVLISSAGHLIKSFIRFTEWITFVPGAINNLFSINNQSILSRSTLPKPAPDITYLILIVGVIIIEAAFYLSIRKASSPNKNIPFQESGCIENET